MGLGCLSDVRASLIAHRYGWLPSCSPLCLLVALLAGCATTDQAPPTTILTGNSNGLMVVSLTVTPTRGHPLHWHLYDVARPGERLKYLVGYAGTGREDWAPGDRFNSPGRCSSFPLNVKVSIEGGPFHVAAASCALLIDARRTSRYRWRT